MTRRPGFVPDFSSLAAAYSSGRPLYPGELFAWLASVVEPRRLAWDCATGNGQAAIGLVRHFDRVVATDVSEAQLAHAAPHPRIAYRAATAQESGLEPSSVDLVTVAAAVHWFDLDAFQREVVRVVRPGGVLAIWSYHIAFLEPPFDAVLAPFYEDFLGPYFGEGVRLVDRKYADLDLVGEALEVPSFTAEARWTLDDMRRFVGTWSGVQVYKDQHGDDPYEHLRPRLEAMWGDPASERLLRWPLYVRAHRL